MTEIPWMLALLFGASCAIAGYYAGRCAETLRRRRSCDTLQQALLRRAPR